MINIDEQWVFDMLDKAIAERGENYAYPTFAYGPVECLYVDHSTGERQPSCLVGLMLYMAGVPLEVLESYEGWVAEMMINVLPGVSCTPYAKSLLGYAQGRQDIGMPWGDIHTSVHELNKHYHTQESEVDPW